MKWTLPAGLKMRIRVLGGGIRQKRIKAQREATLILVIA